MICFDYVWRNKHSFGMYDAVWFHHPGPCMCFAKIDNARAVNISG